MNPEKARLLACCLALFCVFPAARVDGQGTNTFTDGSIATPSSWGTAGNWSGGEVPGVNYTGSGAYDTIGQNVVIGTITPATALSGLAVDTTFALGPSYSSVSIGSLTFNNTTGVDIFQLNTEQLTVSGNITNSTSVSDTLSLPVSAGSSATYSGGTGGLIFDANSTLNVGTFAIATTSLSGTPTVQVLGSLTFTINATNPGIANTTHGSIGSITTGTSTAIGINGTYTTTATLASDEGDFFQLGPAFPGVTLSPSSLPQFTDTNLTWITSLIQKGILVAQPVAGGNYINTGVILPIDNDTEFNSGAIILNGGELLTSNNSLDQSLAQGTAFSTSRAVTVESTGGTIAATSGTTATYSGAIADAGVNPGLLSIDNSSSTGTVVFKGADTYAGGTAVTAGTLQIGTGGSLASSGSVTLGSGAQSATLLLGDSGGAVNQTLASLTTSGTGASDAVVGGATGTSTITINNSGADLYNGVLGGSTGDENNVAVTMSGSSTLTLSGSNTYTGATTISAGTLNITGSTPASGAVSVASGAKLGGNGSTGIVTVAGGGAIDLQNGAIGTLTVAGLNIGNATTPSSMSFDIGSGSSNNLDKLVDDGTLVVTGASGTDIIIGNVSGTPTLSNGTYALITYSGTAPTLSDFDLMTTTLDNKSLSLSLGTDVIDLVITNEGAGSVTTTYNLSASTSASRLMKTVGTATLTATITNTGTTAGQNDTLDYTGLNVTAPGGTLSGGTLPKSGGPVGVNGGTDSGTKVFTAGSTTGAFTITPTVTTATNANLGGNATLGTTTTGTIDVVDNRVVTASTVAFGRVLVGQAVSQTSTLTTTGADANFTRVTVGTAGADANGISATGGTDPTFNSAAVTDTRTVGGTFASAGSVTGSLTLHTTGEGLTGEAPINVSLGYTGDAVHQRTFTNGATTNLGFLHVGDVVNATSNAFSSTGLNATTTNVQVAGTPASGSPDANGISLTGSATSFLGASASQSATRTLAGTITGSGTVNGTFDLAATTLENGGSGLAGETAYAPVVVAYTANVYSGQSVWDGTGASGSWGTVAGTGSSAFGINWGAGEGSPGLDANFTSTDSATFNNVSGQPTVTVSLNGASPSLASITFNALSTDYTVAQGSSGTITLNGGAGTAVLTSAGTQAISAPVNLATATTASVTNTLTISGVVGGVGGLTKTGAGSLVLSNADTYAGMTAVNGGVLSVGGSTLSTGTVSVADGAVLSGTGSTGAVNLAGGAAIDLQDGIIGTLTVHGLTLGEAGTPTALSFDIGSGSSSNLDKIADSGALTASGAGGTTITIGNVSGTPTLTNGTYTLISYSGTAPTLNDFTLDTTSLDGKSLSLVEGSSSIELVVANTTGTTYSLTSTATDTRIMSGQSTGITTTIANTGTLDTLNFTGLGSSTTGVSGSTTSGGPLAINGGSSSNTGQTFTGSTTGAQTIVPTVASATNATLGGSATLGSTTSATVDVLANRVVTASSANFGRIIIGQAASTTSTLTTTGSDSSFTRVTVGVAGPDANGVSASGGTNPTFNSATVTDTRSVSGTFATAGDASGTLVLPATGEGLVGEAPINVDLSYSADAVNKRTITNGAGTNLGLFHTGATVTATTSNAFTSSGLNVDTTSVQVAGTPASGSPDANGVTLTGSTTDFTGATASQSATRSFGGTITGAGAVTGSFNLAVTTLENNGAGLTGEGSYVPVNVAYTATVYTGQSVWNTNGSGSWGTLAGTGPDAFGANWGATQGSPGLDPNFADTDAATFNNTALTPGATATVTLDGADPSLKSITFNTTGGGYTIAPGSSGTLTLDNGSNPATVTVTAGSQTISAPIQLASNVTVSGAGELALSGIISGSKDMTFSGSGTVALNAANTYTGSTLVNGGTVKLGSIGALAQSSSVTLDSGTLDLNGFNETLQNFSGTGGTLTNSSATPTTVTFSQNGETPALVSAAAIPALSGPTDTYSGNILGNMIVNQSGPGTLILTGANMYTGGTTITGGALLAGSATALGNGNVSNGGILGASGVNGINVTGTYTQTAGGVLDIRLSATPPAVPDLTMPPGVTTGNDQLDVTGSAALAGQLALTFVSSANFAPAKGQVFEIVGTTGGITGDFTDVTTTPSAIQVTTQISTDNDNLYVDVLSTQLALKSALGNDATPNRLSIANYVDGHITSGPLFKALSTVAANPAALAGGLDQLSPIPFENFVRSTTFNNEAFNVQGMDTYFDSQRSVNGDFLAGNGQIDSSGLTVINGETDPALAQVTTQLLAWNPAPLAHGLLADSPSPVLGGVDMKDMKQMAPPPEEGPAFNTFVLGNVVLAQEFSQDDVPHASSTTGGVQLGADYRVTPHLRVGVVFGFGHTDADLDNNGSKGTIDTYSPGIYLSFADAGWYFNIIGSYGFDELSEHRQVSIGGLSTQAQGSPSGDQIVGNFDGGYDFHAKNWVFGPTAGVLYTHLGVDSFSETGAPAVDLNIDRAETDSLRSRLGGHVAYAFQNAHWVLTPHLDASWQHDFMDQSRGITSQFSSVGAGSFTVTTPSPSRDSALLDAGLSADFDGDTTVYLDYLLQAGQSNYFGQSVQAGARFGF